MITRFFSTSKPIHFVIIILLTFVAFMSIRISSLVGDLSFIIILKQFGFYAVALTSIFVLDFLANKNNLTKKNSYKILLFSLFIIIIPVTIQFDKVLLSNLFVLLAIRRIISLRSNVSIKKNYSMLHFGLGLQRYFIFGLFCFSS